MPDDAAGVGCEGIEGRPGAVEGIEGVVVLMFLCCCCHCPWDQALVLVQLGLCKTLVLLALVWVSSWPAKLCLHRCASSLRKRPVGRACLRFISLMLTENGHSDNTKDPNADRHAGGARLKLPRSVGCRYRAGTLALPLLRPFVLPFPSICEPGPSPSSICEPN